MVDLSRKPIVLAKPVYAGSNKKVNISFLNDALDELDPPPLTFRWSLTNDDGAVINSRTQVVVALADSVTAILLQGADLPDPPAGQASHVLTLTIEVTYDVTIDAATVEDVPFVQQVKITVLKRNYVA